MTFNTFLFTYVLGGLTFLPLLLLAIVVPGWLLLPEVPTQKKDAGSDDGANKEQDDGVETGKPRDEVEDAGASGTFAVLRKYDFPAALAVLNAKPNASTSTGSAGQEGIGETSHGTESVYQSMYRSVFDRNKTTTPSNSILANEDAASDPPNTKTGKKTTPANIFYIVLRHGHLMLYDSSAEREVRHVIRLSLYDVSFSSGPHEPESQHIKDGELFIKRTAIVLTPIASKDFMMHADAAQSPLQTKPFFLFSSTCIEKEDFYHALLSTRQPRPIPQPLDTHAVIKLQSTLHSTSALTPETQAINALISRIFLALYQSDRLKTMVRNKIEKKISRVQKPAFIASLAVQSIDLGDAAPILSNFRLQELHIGGDLTIAFDIKYNGGVKVVVSAVAKLDLGPRFKTRTADLLLSTALQRLQGHMLIRIKPSPSNRLWFCFESIPDMDIKVEPIVSQRQITYTFILRAIEERIRAVVGETLVKPNWDDVPFLDTREQQWRGGIWSGESVVAPPSSDLRKRHQKTMSMPSLANPPTEPDSSATSSGSEGHPKLTSSVTASDRQSDLKRRSATSLRLDPASEHEARTPPAPPRGPLRNPSLTSPSASAASIHLDESSANFDPQNGDAASDRIQPQQTRWRILPTAAQQRPRKDAIETMRAMRDKSMVDHDAEEAGDSAFTAEPGDMDANDSRRSSESPAPSMVDRSLRQTKRGEREASYSSTSTTRSQRQQEAVQKGKTILAATAAATTAATAAAKNWSWANLGNRNGKGGRNSLPGQPQEPLGRGQPLPPPGMPLPGPQKTWLPAGMGSVKRKPVLPQRKNTVEEPSEANGKSREDLTANADHHEAATLNVTEPGHEPAVTPASEFGPWRENSGPWDEENEDLQTMPAAQEEQHDPEVNYFGSHTASSATSVSDEHPVTKRAPPPLPPRRPSALGDEVAGTPIESNTLNQQEDIHDEPESEHHTFSTETADVAVQDGFRPRRLTHDEANDVITNPQTEPESEEGMPKDQQSMSTEVVANDPDDLVAIPAPADDDADEAHLEVEGIQGDDDDVAEHKEIGRARAVTALHNSEQHHE